MYKILFIIGLILSISSCTSTREKSTSPLGTTPDTPPSYEEPFQEVSSKLETTEEFQGCMKTSIMMCRDNSALKASQRTGDIAYCDELDTPESRGNCRFALTVTSALKENNIASCESLDPPYKIACMKQVYKSQALKSQDLNICDMIASSSGTIKKEDRNDIQECIMAVIIAGSGSTEKSCEKLADPTLKNQCKLTLKNRK